MVAPKARKLKTISLVIGGTEFSSQLKSWTLNNNTDDGDTVYFFGGNDLDPTEPGAIVEDSDADWSLSMTFASDWASGGISDFLTVHDGENAAFTLDHLPNQVGEHVRWSGNLKIKAPNAGGDANATEETEVELKVVGIPFYQRIG